VRNFHILIFFDFFCRINQVINKNALLLTVFLAILPAGLSSVTFSSRVVKVYLHQNNGLIYTSQRTYFFLFSRRTRKESSVINVEMEHSICKLNTKKGV